MTWSEASEEWHRFAMDGRGCEEFVSKQAAEAAERNGPATYDQSRSLTDPFAEIPQMRGSHHAPYGSTLKQAGAPN